MSFMLALPKISLHGAGAIGDMVKLVADKQWGKALIVTDGQLVKLGLLDSLFAALDEQQLPYHLFDEVFPNPTEALVQQGYAAYREAGCDYLIAFGGGSPIDTAKAVKILTANPAPSTAYSGVGKVKNAGVPLVAINTTAGTAAEMTSNAVIIAAFLMGLVTFGLSLLNVPGIVMSIIIGAMLIVVISLPIITRRMMQRRRI